MLVHHLWLLSTKVKEKEVWLVRELVVQMREYSRLKIAFMLLEDHKLFSG